MCDYLKHYCPDPDTSNSHEFISWNRLEQKQSRHRQLAGQERQFQSDLECPKTCETSGCVLVDESRYKYPLRSLQDILNHPLDMLRS